MTDEERDDETKYLQSLEKTLDRLISLASRMSPPTFGTDHYLGITHATAIISRLIKDQKEKLA
jgi:hypothetical protein